MVVAEINTLCYGSTGSIMLGIHKEAQKQGIEVYSFYALGSLKENNADIRKIGSDFSNRISGMLSHFTGLMGCFSIIQTLKLISFLKKSGVDIIHLHNIHISFLNYPLLFGFIKNHNIKVVWTLHDCWTFTGHCPHFTYQKCEKWMTGCYKCPRYKEYPVSSFDNSSIMYSLKKKCFSDLPNAVLVTPSEWLKALAEKSFLKAYPVRVINNGIDLETFSRTESNFREKYGIENKFVILGVSFGWDNKKGLDVFIDLARRLDSERFQIVLVGTNESTDRLLPDNVISIHKTSDISEMVQIYSAADLLLNPTREEVLGLVNIEANACGVPVLMFRTGGSPECISEKSGCCVDCDDTDELEKQILYIEKNRPYNAADCRKQAEKFDKRDMYKKYIALYQNL